MANCRRAPLPWIAAAAITGAVAVDGARRWYGAEVTGPRALVARHEVPVGQPITNIDFLAAVVPELPADALTDQDLHQLRGFRTITVLRAGDVLRRPAVALKTETPLRQRIPFGARAYALDRAPGLPLAVGDRVDIFGGSEQQSVRVAQNLLIVAMNDDGLPVAAVPDSVVRLLEESRRHGAVTVVLRRPDEPLAAKRSGQRPTIPVLEGAP